MSFLSAAWPCSALRPSWSARCGSLLACMQGVLSTWCLGSFWGGNGALAVVVEGSYAENIARDVSLLTRMVMAPGADQGQGAFGLLGLPLNLGLGVGVGLAERSAHVFGC